jgi:hypothetical protein
MDELDTLIIAFFDARFDLKNLSLKFQNANIFLHFN